MKSPFPGMDPYLEARWGDMHQRLYLQKQRDLLRSETNLVEIDLLRSGNRVIAFPQHRIPPARRNEYLACIRCARSERTRKLYGLPLRKRLFAIPIPVRQSDQPIPLNLQALIDQCYHNGRYDDIDYAEPPAPPLSSADAEWANALLETAGKR